MTYDECGTGPSAQTYISTFPESWSRRLGHRSDFKPACHSPALISISYVPHATAGSKLDLIADKTISSASDSSAMSSNGSAQKPICMYAEGDRAPLYVDSAYSKALRSSELTLETSCSLTVFSIPFEPVKSPSYPTSPPSSLETPTSTNRQECWSTSSD